MSAEAPAAAPPSVGAAAKLGDVTTTGPEQPWHRRRAVRLLAVRLAVRAVALAVLVVLLRVLSAEFSAAGAAYIAWIRSLGPAGGPAAFWVVACVF
jgi:hypothetical protein